MWDKNIREVLFLILYEQNYLTSKLEEPESWDTLLAKLDNLSFYTDVISPPDSSSENFHLKDSNEEELKEPLMAILENYAEQKNTIIKYLQPLVTSWNKTNLMLQCLMIEYVLEKADSQSLIESNPKKLLNTYLQLANKYLESTNISTLHAVISKDLGLQNILETSNDL